MRFLKKCYFVSGQALIIGLLFVVIISTLVLALISRSLKDVQISTESQKELRTFSAAEAGLEKVLNNPDAYLSSGSQINVNNIQVNVDSQQAQWNRDMAFTFPDGLVQDNVRQFFLSQYNESTKSLDDTTYYQAGSLDILWGKVGADGQPVSNQPGVEITLYYKDNNNSGQIKIKRYAYDSQGRGNFSTTGVTDVSNNTYATIFGSKRFAYKVDLDFGLASGEIPLFLRVRFLFNGNVQQPLAFAVPSDKTGDYTYPTQGYKITSQANPAQVNSAVQRLEAFKSFPTLPAFFDYALFSGTNLAHQ